MGGQPPARIRPGTPGRMGGFMRKSVGLALGVAAVIGAALAPAAASAAAGSPAALAAGGGSDPSTAVTFSVTTGALTISVPSTASLGIGTPGSVIRGLLGNVTVTDNRAALTASWTASVSSTAFTTGTATPAETIPAADAAYDAGTVTPTGTITITTTDVTLSGTPQAVVAGSSGTGNNSAQWNPTISVTVPSTAVGGTYAGTISHSVA